MYTYQALPDKDSIRVLTILPRSSFSDDDLHLSISAWNQKQAPPYEALSYVWGDWSNPASIKLDKQDLTIGRNLYDALMQMRLDDKPRTLWADAICINQQDVVERSQQVAKMADIYQNGSSTVMWLGKQGSLPQPVLDVLGSLASKSASIEEILKNHNGVRTSSFGVLIPTAMDELMRQPYFTRTWITQEIALSKHLVLACGPFQCSFDALSRIFVTIADESGGSDKTRTFWRSLGQIRSAVQKVHGNAEEYDHNPNDGSATSTEGDVALPHLSQLLSSERDRAATDPRDKLYALLGIAGLFHSHGLYPDYSLPVNDVYIHLARHLLAPGYPPGMTNLICTSQPAYSTRNLPSWVPDWSQPWRGGIGQKYLFHAGVNLPEFSRVGITPDNSLLLKGYQLDTIRKSKSVPVNSWRPNRWLPEPFMARLAAETANLGYHGTYAPTKEEYTTVLMQVLTGCTTPDWFPEKPFFQDYNASSDFEINPLNPHKRRWDRFFRNLAWSDGEWDLIETDKGFLGLGPASVRPGDLVCIMGGVNVPLILRPLGEHGGYTFVGDAYIHSYSVMFGKPVEGETIDIEDFLIF